MIYSHFLKNTKLYFRFGDSLKWMSLQDAKYHIERSTKKVDIYVSTNQNSMDEELLITSKGELNEPVFYPLINNVNMTKKIFRFFESYLIKFSINW